MSVEWLLELLMAFALGAIGGNVLVTSKIGERLTKLETEMAHVLVALKDRKARETPS